MSVARTRCFYLLFIVITSACTQEIDLFSDNIRTLVVDGSITNDKKAHTVKLYTTTGYNVISDFVDDAVVKIVDDLGNSHALYYSAYGAYKTSSDFSGSIGRSYFIDIRLASGENYQSISDEMLSGPSIESLSYVLTEGSLKFRVDFQDTPGVRNYYRWGYQGTYEVLAPQAGAPWNRCWVNDFDLEYLKVESDRLFDGRKMTDFGVFAIPLDRKFEYGYYMFVEQNTLSKPAYEYWSAMEAQLGNTGSLFETTNFQIVGNIRNTEDPDELVLGFFEVSSVYTDSLFIDMYNGRFGPINCDPNPNVPSRCFDCRLIGSNPTNIKPSFWPK